MNKAELVGYFLEKQILLAPDFLNNLPDPFDEKTFLEISKKRFRNSPLILNNDLFRVIHENDKNFDINWPEFDSSRTKFEKGKPSTTYNYFLNLMEGTQQEVQETKTVQVQQPQQILPEEGRVVVVKSYNETPIQREVQDFVDHFKARYESLKKILLARPELQNSLSINRVSKKQEREQVSIIGMITEKNVTKNGNIMLIVEDPTGLIKVSLSKSKEELFEIAQDLVLDEIIGITGVTGNNIIFANNLYFPDVPLNHELKKAPDEAYAIFVSDIHFGLGRFLEEDFLKFVQWLKGEYGTEQQREIAKKVKYVFAVGDIVEGVGIYPGQDEDLTAKDIYAQYELATKYFKMIPSHIKIIICGGNHDAMRIAEPQPPFDPKISKGFYEIPNMTIVSNPAMVNIHSSEHFPGFDILLYHGWSLIYYADNVPSIRQKGGQDRCDLILKFYLQRRHLAPTHGSNLYIPDPTQDPLVIDKVPDILVTGHIHRIVAGTYRNVTIINSSCWVTQSEDQARRGIVPNPAKIPIINLKTREIKIMNFRSE